MYVDYWGLEQKPFEPGLDSEALLFHSESHSGAFSKVRYAIDEGRGAAALAGPSGVGKTLLVRRVVAGLDASTRPAVHLVFPQMSHRDLLTYLATRLGAESAAEPIASADEAVRRLEDLTTVYAERGVQPLIVIDEAQLLEDAGALETIRLLLNFGGERPAFTVLLVGQMGLLSAVARSPALDERLAVKTLLRGFTADETAGYVEHRLEAAGGRPSLFSRAAVQRLHARTGGVARQINRLADLALVVGFAEQASEIGPDHIESVHHELVEVGA